MSQGADEELRHVLIGQVISKLAALFIEYLVLVQNKKTKPFAFFAYIYHCFENAAQSILRASLDYCTAPTAILCTHTNTHTDATAWRRRRTSSRSEPLLLLATLIDHEIDFGYGSCTLDREQNHNKTVTVVRNEISNRGQAWYF